MHDIKYKSIKTDKYVCSISVSIHYWQPYLLALYDSFLLACRCEGFVITIMHYKNTSMMQISRSIT